MVAESEGPSKKDAKHLASKRLLCQLFPHASTPQDALQAAIQAKQLYSQRRRQKRMAQNAQLQQKRRRREPGSRKHGADEDEADAGDEHGIGGRRRRSKRSNQDAAAVSANGDPGDAGTDNAVQGDATTTTTDAPQPSPAAEHTTSQFTSQPTAATEAPAAPAPAPAAAGTVAALVVEGADAGPAVVAAVDAASESAPGGRRKRAATRSGSAGPTDDTPVGSRTRARASSNTSPRGRNASPNARKRGADAVAEVTEGMSGLGSEHDEQPEGAAAAAASSNRKRTANDIEEMTDQLRSKVCVFDAADAPAASPSQSP